MYLALVIILHKTSLESEMLHNTALELQHSEKKWLKPENFKLQRQARIRPRITSAKKVFLLLCRQCTMTNSKIKRTSLFLGQASMTTARVQGRWRQRQIGVLVLSSNVQKPNLEQRVLLLKLSTNLNMKWPKAKLQFLALELTSVRVSRITKRPRVLVTTILSRRPSLKITNSIWAKNWKTNPRSMCQEAELMTRCPTQLWKPPKATLWESSWRAVSTQSKKRYLALALTLKTALNWRLLHRITDSARVSVQTSLARRTRCQDLVNIRSL